MNITELYNVVIQRKSQATQVQLNYVHKGAAETTFDRIMAMIEDGHVPRAQREVFEDYFGAKIALDRDDIGNVLFIDAKKSLEMQGVAALMQAMAQQKTQREAQGNPLINGQLITPVPRLPAQ